MKPRLRSAFEDELRASTQAERAGDFVSAWHHLERAHVLSQAYAAPHLRVHALMLRHGWARGERTEVLGQLIRLVVAAPGSWLGRAPLGNTGGANVGLLTPMPIPADLRALLELEA